MAQQNRTAAANDMTPQQLWETAVQAYQQGDLKRARKALKPLVEGEISLPGEVFLLAGMVEAQFNETEAAEAHLQKAVKMVPERPEAWTNLGNVQLMQGNAIAAEASFRKVLKGAPDHVDTLNNLGVALEAQGRPRDALDCFDRVLELHPEFPGAARSRAQNLVQLQRADEARVAYEALLAESSDDPLLAVEYAEFLERDNRPEEAAAKLPASDRLTDVHAIARIDGLRARLLERNGEYQQALALVRDARERSGQDWLSCAEGWLLDRLGRYEEAMQAFGRGNRARAKQWNFRRLREQRFAEFVADKLARGPRPVSETAEPDGRRDPVFVVGLPRSGTTLLDRMFGAHPETQVLEELTALRAAEDARRAGEGPDRARAAYWEQVSRHVDIDPDRLVVDKNPLHAAHLDLIPALFPQARVVLMLRHPYDAALSSWMQDFDANPATVHFLELESTAALSADLLGLMRSFEQTWPEQAVRVRYEDLVADFRSEITRVLQAIGLDWHDDVADYANRSRETGMVTTPSYAQVTQALYGSAVERWRNYERWLQPFDEKLQPMLEPFGYER